MKVLFTERAGDELEAILTYIRDFSPQGASRVKAAIRRALLDLELFPHAGRSQTVPGVRRIVARPYPYNIFYMVNDEEGEVLILSVQHAARDRNFEDT